MSLLVDTGVLYAHHDRDAEHHEAAKEAMTAVLNGEYGQPYVTDYVYDETVTLTRRRMEGFDDAKTVSDRILGTDALKLIRIERRYFEKAVETFERYKDQSLSFTDASTVSVTEEREIDYVLSFDDDFDGVVDRLDPLSIDG
jgi:predicted nucleic acid-binding protein